MSDTAPRPRISRNTKFVIGLIALLIWTAAAADWQDKGCGMVQGYGFVILHGGWPDEHEGCEDGPVHPTYTSDYRG